MRTPAVFSFSKHAEQPAPVVSGETPGHASHSLSLSVVVSHPSLLCILYDMFCVDLNFTFLPLIDEPSTMCLQYGHVRLAKGLIQKTRCCTVQACEMIPPAKSMRVGKISLGPVLPLFPLERERNRQRLSFPSAPPTVVVHTGAPPPPDVLSWRDAGH